MNKKFGFIGCGNMATAILNGMLSNSFVSADSVYIYDLDASKCQGFVLQGATLCDSVSDVVLHSDIILLAVKPQNFPDVLPQIKSDSSCHKLFVSIAAGISISYIRELLGYDAMVVRVMPNTPLLLSKGASALSPSDNVSADDFDIIKGIFDLLGVVEIIDEKHMNKIISLNGSSPAFFYLFTKAMLDYAVECGIDSDSALNLICATLEGSACMMRESSDDIDTLIKKVSSPGGTTIAALNSFEENNFVEIIQKAMNACTDRAQELGK